jgi:hypothetical protein
LSYDAEQPTNQQQPETRICEYCGKEFVIKNIKTKRFCSRLCKNRCLSKRNQKLKRKSYKGVKLCVYCGKEFFSTRKSHICCSHPCSTKVAQLSRDFGLTITKYNALIEKQEGKCPVCGVHQRDLKITLCVDHNHGTGKVRGLLCSNCNIGLGLIGDTLEKAERLVQYLKMAGVNCLILKGVAGV